MDLGLSGVSTPGSGTCTLRLRGQGVAGELVVDGLFQEETSPGVWTTRITISAASFATGVWSTATGTCAVGDIASWSNAFRLRVTRTSGRGDITWSEVETPDAGGTTFELDCETGSFIISGSGINPDIEISAASGSYVIVGALMTPTLEAALSAGSYLITGLVADLEHLTGTVIDLDCQPGVYAIVGAEASVVGILHIDAQPGGYAVTGAVMGPSIEVGLNPGAYAIIGALANLVGTYVLNAESGSYSLVGAPVAPSIEVSMNPGSYQITGLDALFARIYQMIADPGAYNIIGFDAQLIQPGLVLQAGLSVVRRIRELNLKQVSERDLDLILRRIVDYED